MSILLNRYDANTSRVPPMALRRPSLISLKHIDGAALAEQAADDLEADWQTVAVKAA